MDNLWGKAIEIVGGVDLGYFNKIIGESYLGQGGEIDLIPSVNKFQ